MNTRKKVEMLIDPFGNTINLWWEKPLKSDFVVPATNKKDVIYFNKQGKPKGVEIIDFFPKEIDVLKYIKDFCTVKSD